LITIPNKAIAISLIVTNCKERLELAVVLMVASHLLILWVAIVLIDIEVTGYFKIKPTDRVASVPDKKRRFCKNLD